MNSSTGVFRSIFSKRRRSFLFGAMASVFAGASVSAQSDKKPSPKESGKKRYHMVVLTNAAPGKDHEFNDWYTNTHLREVLAIPGFVSAQRFTMVRPLAEHPFKYCAIYDLETDDPEATVQEMMRRNGTDQLHSPVAMDSNAYAVVYEAITPVVTRA